jgi:nucleotide-binding universal stress UspA family protein
LDASSKEASVKIMIAVDGSESAGRAVSWVAEHAGALGAEVVAVHAVDQPAYLMSAFNYYPVAPITDEGRDAIAEVAEREWCAPLTKREVPVRVVLRDGAPATVLLELANEERPDLVVTGQRGLGGFAELLLGSTSHQLAHHLDRPLLIVP